MIVKVQVPLYSSKPATAQALVYNQDHSVELMAPIDEELLRRMGKAVKRYFHAEVRDGDLYLGDEAPDQPW